MEVEEDEGGDGGSHRRGSRGHSSTPPEARALNTSKNDGARRADDQKQCPHKKQPRSNGRSGRKGDKG